jgi:hypothetical protein
MGTIGKLSLKTLLAIQKRMWLIEDYQEEGFARHL